MEGKKVTWTIVCFIEESTVEAVPTAWIVGDMCYFPATTKAKVTSAITTNEPVNYDWPKHKIKTFRNGTYDDYAVARQKARIAEDTSELNSSEYSEAENRPKKRRITKRFSSDSESESDGPVTAKLKCPPKLATTSLATDHEPYSQNISKITTPATPLSRHSILSCDQRKQFEDETDHCNNLCNKCCRHSNTCDKKIQNLTTQCHLMRSILTDISNDIKEIKSNGLKTQNQNENQVSFYETCGINFPLENEEDLQSFETYLTIPENFELATKEMARSGGDSSYDFVRRIMTPLISNNLAEKFNWEGKKKKKKFKDLNLAKLVLEADKKANISNSTKECEKSVVGWLKRAKERRERVQKVL